MKKKNLLLAFTFSLILIIAGCGDSTEESDATTDDMEETVVDEDAQDESSVNEEVAEEAEENSSSNWFDQTKNMEAYYYEVNTDLADGTSFLTKVWASGNKTKMESTYPDTGEEIIMIINGEDDFTYLYMPAENTALKMKLGNLSNFAEETAQQTSQDYVEILKELADDETVVSEKDQLDGKTVTLVTGEFEGNTNKIWISDESGFPLKSEFYMDGSLESTSTFEEFEETSIDPSTFTLPEGVEIQDMTNY